MHETPWLTFEESTNRYRVQGPMFAEREGLIPGPSDVGASVWARGDDRVTRNVVAVVPPADATTVGEPIETADWKLHDRGKLTEMLKEKIAELMQGFTIDQRESVQ